MTLEEMHEYCHQYRDSVRNGGLPSKDQDALFMEYQAICYDNVPELEQIILVKTNRKIDGNNSLWEFLNTEIQA